MDSKKISESNENQNVYFESKFLYFPYFYHFYQRFRKFRKSELGTTKNTKNIIRSQSAFYY